MPEIELKLIVDEPVAKDIWRRARDAGLTEAIPRASLLRTIYHDTPDHALKTARIALRLRKVGRRWVQTVKTKADPAGGLHISGEWDAPAPGGRIRLDAIPDETMRLHVQSLIGEAETDPICETAMRRQAGDLVAPDGSVVEMAVDIGEIAAGPSTAAFTELEFELKSGRVRALFDLAEQLMPEGGLNFSRLSKGERGYLLAVSDVIEPTLAPRKASAVRLDKKLTSEQAAQAVLRESFAQVAHNLEVVRSLDDSGGPHQLRVGLRRLRSALTVFASALDSPETERLAAEGRWMGQEVGALRDLDVALEDVVGKAFEAHPTEAGFAVLSELIEKQAAKVRAELRQTLEGRRAQAFVFALARYIECRGWLAPEDLDQTARLAMPVKDLARASLARAWKRCAKRARGVEALSIDARHDLRKALKALRYAAEFLGPLFPETQVKPFLKRLKRLQTIFGDLNDLAMAEALFTGPAAIGAKDPDAQRAVGYLLGASSVRAEIAWDDAARLWKALAAEKPFWT